MIYVQLKWSNSLDPLDQGSALLPLPVRIGRAADNDFVLQRRLMGVSRWHAQLASENEGVAIYDEGSRNGVYLQQDKVIHAMLPARSHIHIGAYKIHIVAQNQCSNENCNQHVAYDARLCPHCGYFLADALTSTNFGVHELRERAI